MCGKEVVCYEGEGLANYGWWWEIRSFGPRISKEFCSEECVNKWIDYCRNPTPRK